MFVTWHWNAAPIERRLRFVVPIDRTPARRPKRLTDRAFLPLLTTGLSSIRSTSCGQTRPPPAAPGVRQSRAQVRDSVLQTFGHVRVQPNAYVFACGEATAQRVPAGFEFRHLLGTGRGAHAVEKRLHEPGKIALRLAPARRASAVRGALCSACRRFMARAYSRRRSLSASAPSGGAASRPARRFRDRRAAWSPCCRRCLCCGRSRSRYRPC